MRKYHTGAIDDLFDEFVLVSAHVQLLCLRDEGCINRFLRSCIREDALDDSLDAERVGEYSQVLVFDVKDIVVLRAFTVSR
jgi:hypothetical protein